MKKSILLGALAFFAIGAMSIQNVEAQEPVKKAATTEVSKKPAVKADDQKTEKQTVTSEKAEKPHDCCASKEVKKDEKKGDCCASKSEKKVEKKAECSSANGKCDKKEKCEAKSTEKQVTPKAEKKAKADTKKVDKAE